MVTDNPEEDAAGNQGDIKRTYHLIDQIKPENEAQNGDERTPLKNKTTQTLLQKVLLIAFAFTGNTVVMTVYGYPSGFLLEYLTDKGMNESVGKCWLKLTIDDDKMKNYFNFMI